MREEIPSRCYMGIIALVGILSMASCIGGASPGPLVPGSPNLFYCGTRMCFTDRQVCVVSEGSQWCTCSESAPCHDEIQRCVAGLCVCDDTRCAEGSECISADGLCVPVKCGRTIACPNEQICDPYVHECYPASGACQSADDCPRFDGRVAAAFALSCEESLCRLRSKNVRAPGTENVAPLGVLAPLPGTTLPREAQPTFRFADTGTPALLLVLDGLPTSEEEVASRALWGLAAPAGRSMVAWSEGEAIQRGVWTATSATIPKDVPLYLLVQAVRGGALVAVSDLVPFRIGSAFAVIGTACSDSAMPAACASPAIPMGCRGGACAVLCASDQDCVPYAKRCGPPESGDRFCQ